MKRMVLLSFVILLFLAVSLFAFEAHYEENCPGCGGTEHREINIPTPTPSFEGGQRKCYTEEYVCGQTCWEGSYDGDPSRQRMGYCIDKICSRTVCE